MPQSIEFIKDRAAKTLSAAKQVSGSWTWDEKSIGEMDSALAAITGAQDATPPVAGQEALAMAAELTVLDARGQWDQALDQLHRWTMQGVNMAKTRYRNDPANLVQVSGLSSSADSRADVLSEALAWESAWKNAEPGWTPLPALTLAAFSALRGNANENLKTAYHNSRAEWRKAAGKLNEMARDLEDMSEAWYANAIRVFPAGTAEGDMIRGTIPTTYTPEKPKAEPATPIPA